MASSIEIKRIELYDFFDHHIVPLIKEEKHTKELLTKITNKLKNGLDKYKFVVKQYGSTIRVSANYLPVGIIFFMASTENGKEPHVFKEPCYWGKNG